MICEKCQKNQANVQMVMNINQQEKHIKICSECYRKMKQPFNQQFGSFDDIFKQMFSNSNFHQSGFSEQQANQVQTKNPGRGGGFLDQHGRNLTEEARQGRIDAVIGRDKEVERLIEVLNRRTKNNPVLIGEAGVGKTAIVEGFALKITEGKVPAKLRNKEVYTLEMNSLVAGTSYRGQFEEKMKQLIEELQERENVILFIDELHVVIGAGSSSEGSMDAGNILKPALARGDLQIVGATTLKEYRLIEKDLALERRFQPITVKEPSADEAFEILKGIRPIYESYHEVKYSDDVLKACVNLSHRYIQDRFLPDKAIDLMDEAGSKLNLVQSHSDKEQIQVRLGEIVEEKHEATKNEQYEKAAKLRDEEIELQQKLKDAPVETKAVTVLHIEKIIEKQTGIPVSKLNESEQSKLKDLQSRLAKKVIGQENAVEKVAKAVRRGRAGLKSKQRPTASFLFVGPTGTGKTELTKTLAEELFGSKEAMIRLDMSEYMEKHSVSKLIGSPPGYVGHEEAGQLTEQVRRNPYSIVLLDEVEKAHPDVMNMFLQIMEDGRLTDSQGRVVSFKETVIIMTSNAGVQHKKKSALGFGATENADYSSVLETLADYFRPEFLNRFDAIIEFNHLEKEELTMIVDIMLVDLMNTLREQGIKFEINDDAKKKLAELGNSPAFGARPLRRVIQEKIEDQITDLIIDEVAVESVSVYVEEGDLKVQGS
ncbi:ATP-dependent Clp protease ATP-binding subunit [Anaerobacillus arseniciselenatis]|uniref:ATP-dependent Clp protease ATP-binding subunit n=1 Tax=Anaerobacillus arseniciselenatis TaxID=85682 RepID=A0A1S2LND9_9BACI|nr:ATP-dependent Clp protease ATP-binding subunit [Anaerobacillus arseniciselenatis]OIJ14001.1 ATP-dependent Clp protease ATP-binding subunit [Anaerobacillus arseniciselenatis]